MKSITVTVRRCSVVGLETKYKGKRITVGDYDIGEVVKIPKHPYKVTYSLNKRGPFLVQTRCIENRKGKRGSVCFLPPEWFGLRVSRKVTSIRKAEGGRT